VLELLITRPADGQHAASGVWWGWERVEDREWEPAKKGPKQSLSDCDSKEAAGKTLEGYSHPSTPTEIVPPVNERPSTTIPAAFPSRQGCKVTSR
jgi:hypothetical protein